MATSWLQSTDTLPVVPDAAARDARFPAPRVNQRVHNLATHAIEIWTGTAWRPEFGPSTALHAGVFGLVGDGQAASDEPALQRALEAVGEGVLYVPPGSYRLSRGLRLADRAHVTIVGAGAATQLRLDPQAKFGIALSGECRSIRIAGVRISGSGQSDDGQAGIGTAIAARAAGADIIVESCEVTQVARGIYFDAERLAMWRRLTIRNNYVHDCVGTESGSGYGIVNSGGADVVIANNVVERCGRHSIYQSAGGPALIAGNTIRDHRHDVRAGRQYGALEVARSHDVRVIGNHFERCSDGALSIEPHETDATLESGRIIVSGNQFGDSLDQDIFVGGQAASGYGALRDILITGNTFVRSRDAANTREAIRVFHGERIAIRDNVMDASRRYESTYAAIVLSPPGDPAALQDLSIAGNTAAISGNGKPVYLVEVAAGLARSPQRVTIEQNQVALDGGDGSGLVLYDARPTGAAIAGIAGGYRQTIDGWSVDDPPPSQATASLPRFGQTGPTTFLAARDGSITGVAVSSTRARRSGTLTAEAYRNGAPTGLRATLDEQHPTFSAALQPTDGTRFRAGDALELRLSTRDWQPRGSTIRAVLEIES